MHSVAGAPNIIPEFDRTVHIVLDDFGKSGRVYRETDEEDTSLDAVIDDLLTGYSIDRLGSSSLYRRRLVARHLGGRGLAGSQARRERGQASLSWDPGFCGIPARRARGIASRSRVI
jgi:hypothetical protein